ncbi:MAG: ECF transporter S component [Candidatus Bathyarchaeia archaeon]|jgi:ABC-type thiamin/hydroxymethylpyrimidine transport system permease subunit
MNIPVHVQVSRLSTVDLVTIALLAGLGLATKGIVRPVIGVITGTLYIPTGAVAGGLYMMWPVMAHGLVKKTGAATLTALVQAIISLLVPFGNFGVFSFIIYLCPGLAIDTFFLVSRHKSCCAVCCFGASAIANVVGTGLVGVIVLVLPLAPLVFSLVLAAISGGLGGIVAHILLIECRKLGL